MKFEVTKEVEELDYLLYEDTEQFYLTQDEIEQLQEKMIKKAFKYHYENCEIYRNYCNTFGITPDIILTYKDLEKIPLITSTAFKDHKILSCNEDLVVKKCTSSGTLGSISSIYRDNQTLHRFQGSVRMCLEKVVNLYNTFCINLTPSAEEAKDLWIAFTVGNLDLIYPTVNTVIDRDYQPAKVIEAIYQNIGKFDNIAIIGAPIMFVELIKYMQHENIVIEDSENIVFITAGGWKKYSGEAITRESFNRLLETQFKNTNFKNYRDMLNMVELNTLLPECEYQTKHCSPWVKVMIIDPVTFKPVPDGKEGLIAYLDPTTTSYPCFILTDDVGSMITFNKCKCGRTGIDLQYKRRVKSHETKGCALKLDRKYSTKQ